MHDSSTTTALLTLAEEETVVVSTVSRFVNQEVRPVAHALEHGDTYPQGLIDRMKQLGVYGMLVPPPYSEGEVSVKCFALVSEQLARGWMSLAGAMGGHSVVCWLLRHFGTQEQKARYLPLLADGKLRATMALTEPEGGSDLQAIRTVASRTGDGYEVSGTKTWISNARHAGLIALLCKTDPSASPPHRGMSILLVEPGEGLRIGNDLGKLGYKGIESCELFFDAMRVPEEALLGAEEGKGFVQMMRGLELGRVQVAARAVGVAQAALDDALAYARQRETFGRPIWKHQSVANHLADMATKVSAARLLTLEAAARVDGGERADLEAGMAKVFASEAAAAVTLDAIRVHGGAGYSTEYNVERYYRDAPLMMVGEGTNEIQRGIIARRLVALCS